MWSCCRATEPGDSGAEREPHGRIGPRIPRGGWGALHQHPATAGLRPDPETDPPGRGLEDLQDDARLPESFLGSALRGAPQIGGASEMSGGVVSTANDELFLHWSSFGEGLVDGKATAMPPAHHPAAIAHLQAAQRHTPLIPAGPGRARDNLSLSAMRKATPLPSLHHGGTI